VRRNEREAVIMVEGNAETCPVAKSDGISEGIASIEV
jgi:hypothetical protein